MATINQVMVGGQLYDLQPVNIDETLEDIINKEDEERTPFDVAGSMSVKELNDKVDDNLTDLLYIEKFEKTMSVPAGNYVDVTYSIEKSGYTPLGIISFSAGHVKLTPVGIGIDNNGQGYLTINNATTNAINNINASITVLYKKS